MRVYHEEAYTQAKETNASTSIRRVSNIHTQTLGCKRKETKQIYRQTELDMSREKDEEEKDGEEYIQL